MKLSGTAEPYVASEGPSQLDAGNRVPLTAMPSQKQSVAVDPLLGTSVVEEKSFTGASYGSLGLPQTEPKAFEPLPPWFGKDGPQRFVTSFVNIARSLSSSSLRKSGPPPGKIDWVSMAVVYWITLLSEAPRGILMSTAWPFIQSLGGAKRDLGIFVAALALGRMAASVPLGLLSNRFPMSFVLTLASAVQLVGLFLYLFAASLPVLNISRVMIGLGCATMSVCRVHLTRAVPSSQRTYHFAYLSALQFVGFAVLPGVGGLLATLPEVRILPFLTLNSFTYPAFVLAVANTAGIMALYSLYLEPPAPLLSGVSDIEKNDSSETAGLDFGTLVICLLVNITCHGIVTELETVSVPFLLERYAGVSLGRASLYISSIGMSGMFIYLSFKPIATTFSDRAIVVFGLAMAVTASLVMSIEGLRESMPVGMYVGFLGIPWSITYPLAQTAALALFSKSLAGAPAGGYLGLYSTAGSLARIVFAVIASSAWARFGRASVFIVMLTQVSLALALCITFYQRLVPPAAVSVR